MSAIRNWKQFHWPYEPMGNFTRSEPFPGEETKVTYLDPGRKRRKRPQPGEAWKALVAQKRAKEA